MKHNYIDVKNILTENMCHIIFMKKNGDMRNMLCTRNSRIATRFSDCTNDALIGNDKKSNKENGNIAVIDLEINSLRTFNIDRLCYIEDLGEPETASEFMSLKSKYLKGAQKHREYTEKSLIQDINVDDFESLG